MPAAAIAAQPDDKFRGEVQGVSRAAAISEKHDFSAIRQSRGAFFRELSDTADKLIGKAVLHASAFLELPPDFVCEGGPWQLAENNFPAMTHNPAGGVASIHNQMGSVHNGHVIVA